MDILKCYIKTNPLLSIYIETASGVSSMAVYTQGPFFCKSLFDLDE